MAQYYPRFLKETGYCSPVSGNTAFNAVYATRLDYYSYINEFNHITASNFGRSMEELSRTQLPFFERTYPLDRLDPKSYFVDVAGGFGNFTYFLAQRFPKATFLVQDHPFIVEQAQKRTPIAIKDRVRFQAHNIFSSQPAVDRANGSGLVFLLKIILHDHSDKACQTILTNLLSVMDRGDRILIIDTVVSEFGGSLGASASELLMLSLFGTRHRTLEEFGALINESGEDLIIQNFTAEVEEPDGIVVIEIQKIR